MKFIAVAYDGDVLALFVRTAAPHRVCAPCLAERMKLDGEEARERVALLAESRGFGVRPGLCCVCAEERLTVGIAEH